MKLASNTVISQAIQNDFSFVAQLFQKTLALANAVLVS